MKPNLPPRGLCFLLSWCGLALFLSVSLGCSSQGTVSGQVSFKGKSLSGGQIIFRPGNTRYNPVTATIDPNGHYEVKVPTGAVQISVDNRALKGKGPASVGVSGSEEPGGEKGDVRRGGVPPGIRVGPPPGAIQGGMTNKSAIPGGSGEKPVGTYVEIPSKYYDPTTSGLTTTVTGGPQTFDVKLE
jgi:hypothetical protein